MTGYLFSHKADNEERTGKRERNAQDSYTDNEADKPPLRKLRGPPFLPRRL